MVYQEDVIKVAHNFGGLDLDQADILKGMAASTGSKQLEEIKASFPQLQEEIIRLLL
jgi:DNA polymerase-3 subunit alpha